MEVLFLALYRFFRIRRLLLALIVAAVIAVSAFFVSRLTLEEDISKSMPGENSRISFVINNSRLTNKLIIPLSLKDSNAVADPDRLISFAGRLTDSLRGKDFESYVSTASSRVSDTTVEAMMGLFYDHLPVFLDEYDYHAIDSLLELKNVDRALEKSFHSLVSPTSFALKKYIVRDPLGITGLALSKLRQFQTEDGYEILNGYIFTRDRRVLMLIVDPQNPPGETRKNSLFLHRLDKLLTALLHGEYPDVSAEYYGASAIAVGNAEQIKNDIQLTIVMAMLIILLFVGWFFRKASIPFISFLPALFGGVIALAFIYLVKGTMSTIALGLGSVLLGIIVDYALYFFSLYRAKGNIEAVIRDLSVSIVMCSVTSAIAFFSLLFVKSEVLRDLGLFAGLSIVGSALFALIILPHLVKLKKDQSDNPVIRLASYPYESNRVLILLIVVLTVFFFFSRKAHFETDMYGLNYLSPKMKAAEDAINRISDLSLKSIYVVSTGSNLDKALENNAEVLGKLEFLQRSHVIRRFSNAGTVLINDSLQKERILRWKKYWTPEKQAEIEKMLISSGRQYGFSNEAFAPFYRFIKSDFSVLTPGTFDPLRNLFLNDMITEIPGKTMIISIVKVPNSSRHVVYGEFSGGKNTIVIDRQEITSSFVENVRGDFDLLVKLCLIFVTVTLIVAFGRLETGLIAALPMFVSWLWTLGFMGVFDIRFNIINIIVTTFVFGLGVDYSILMMRGLLLEYRKGQREMTSYRTSIFLSGFTTLVGVGVLIVAKHPSLHSIALISVVGLLSVILVSYTAEPLLFNYLVRKGGKPRLLPVTLADILSTMLAFAIFIAGSLLLNIVFMVVIVLPVGTARKKFFMHQAMAICCKWPVYAMLHIHKNIDNRVGETFEKPAMIISNHQSHIDLLLLLMLHPKIIVMTTRWVWNNPIYALVIRYLEFYPTLEGHEDITEKLRSSVERGYSILVFPEGSRSADNEIKRFHKGAFLMAEKLALDLLPIFIHGAGDCMNKGENHLRGGSVTVRFYPRITPKDALYGSDYHERTKNLQKFYRAEWKKIREELETPAYFRNKVIRNFLYKGPFIEWYTRIKLRLENNFEAYNSHIPRRAKIVDLGCGYGYMSYMLGFVSTGRTILGIDYDEEKIEVARHCISATDNIRFLAGNALDFTFEDTDVFILSDMLHYLPENSQRLLLDKCLAALNENGAILIRDADKDLETRHMGTRYTEFFSTRFGFNKAETKDLYFFSGGKIREFARSNGLLLEITDNSKLTSNVLYVLRKQKEVDKNVPVAF